VKETAREQTWGEQRADSRQHTVDSRKRTVGSRQQTADSEQQTEEERVLDHIATVCD
jgi:hypothetical protein